ncbi:MAG TPA: amidohydrolase [Verrucomicrobiae bacterium]|nr:amidohydrolase [Verrucomicrobiae bacterium]
MRLLTAAFLLAAAPVAASDLSADIDRLAAAAEGRVIEQRRALHQNPELGNRETQTAKRVARRLKELGYDVKTGVAHTGVIGVLKGGLPGPVVGLRADMDALPVAEETGLPFASKVRTTYDGKDVGVMHACGHDGHVAILLGVAEVISQLRARWPGTVKLVFQPAEEGAPQGERGGAELMIEQGALGAPTPEAMFGLHILASWDADQIAYRSGGAMASADDIDITVHGKQTHGAAPWMGVDPIVVASQIVLGLQTVASRQMDSTKAPVIVTIGKIEGGVRNNIIPDRVSMKGTLRALDPAMREDLIARVKRTIEGIAASAGARADVTIGAAHAYPVTFNDPALTAAMVPTLRRVAGEGKLIEASPILGAEDFSFFQQKVPGLYVFVGTRTPGTPAADWASNHSPKFRFDERVLQLGVRTLSNLAADYASAKAPAR